MRTPGHDEDLALGFLIGEGLVAGADAVAEIGPSAELEANVVEVRTRDGLLRDPFDERRFHMTSSCGICGKGALEQVRLEAPGDPAPVRLAATTVLELPGRARAAQEAFERTGGIHATALFDTSGRLLVLREDVGRHNAMDKVIGRALLDGLVPLGERILCVSGRLSFELVQKAAVAGAPILVGVGAPSSLAISLADDRGMTLCGFARRGSVNVYTRPERVREN
jgi:FdhD protein